MAWLVELAAERATVVALEEARVAACRKTAGRFGAHASNYSHHL